MSTIASSNVRVDIWQSAVLYVSLPNGPLLRAVLQYAAKSDFSNQITKKGDRSGDKMIAGQCRFGEVWWCGSVDARHASPPSSLNITKGPQSVQNRTPGHVKSVRKLFN